MGNWGDMPWESDAGLDTAWGFLQTVIISIRSMLAQPLVAGGSSASQIDRVRVCCDMLVRLAPYWGPSQLEGIMHAAIPAMETAIAELADEGLPTSYDDTVLQSLREMAARGE